MLINDMDRLEQIKNAVTANGMREWTDERVGQAMREYADQQNAELRERAKELEEAMNRIMEISITDTGRILSQSYGIAKEALKQEEE